MELDNLLMCSGPVHPEVSLMLCRGCCCLSGLFLLHVVNFVKYCDVFW
jgi:hypothetical protein